MKGDKSEGWDSGKRASACSSDSGTLLYTKRFCCFCFPRCKAGAGSTKQTSCAGTASDSRARSRRGCCRVSASWLAPRRDLFLRIFDSSGKKKKISLFFFGVEETCQEFRGRCPWHQGRQLNGAGAEAWCASGSWCLRCPWWVALPRAKQGV